MVVICEECGKKYRVDPSKIQGKAASFKCRVCSHVIMVFKARVTSSQPDHKAKIKPTTLIDDRLATEEAESKNGMPAIDKARVDTRYRRKAGGFGLRAKMLLLFLLIPLILMTGVSLFYLWHIDISSRLLIQETSKIVTQLAKEKSANISATTAMMQSRVKASTRDARMIALILLGATLLIISIIVFVYTNRLTKKIKSLAEVAERISQGELEMKIETTSRDEIGGLAEAIARMQDNIRLSIERLQHRR